MASPRELRRLDGDRQIFFDLVLADKLAQPLRPQLQLKRRIVLDRRGGDHALAVQIQVGIFGKTGHWPDITMPTAANFFVDTM